MSNKRLTPGNWNLVDPAIASFAKLTATGPQAVTAQDMAEEILSVNLDVLSHIPEGPRDLMESAQATMVYGAYYYPLLTVGLELCGRAGEAAAKARAQQLQYDLWVTGKNGEQRQLSYATLIRILDRAGALHDPEWWEWARRHRNWAAHPERQSIVTPGMALDGLKSYADGLANFFSLEIP